MMMITIERSILSRHSTSTYQHLILIEFVLLHISYLLVTMLSCLLRRCCYDEATIRHANHIFTFRDVPNYRTILVFVN